MLDLLLGLQAIASVFMNIQHYKLLLTCSVWFFLAIPYGKLRFTYCSFYMDSLHRYNDTTSNICICLRNVISRYIDSSIPGDLQSLSRFQFQ